MDPIDADDQLARLVEAELAADFLIDESQIDVEVTDGVVTLAGTVGSYAEKMIAIHAAQSVAGVHDLVNAIGVKPPAAMYPSDTELTAIIEQVLAWDALVPEEDLIVNVADGLVALTGTCATRAQAAEAERAVARLGGVRGVLNRIEVSPPSPAPRKVRVAIEEALQRRARHRAAQLDVTIDGGIVTLRGRVGSPLEHRAILGAVAHLGGIEEVRDELRVEPGDGAAEGDAPEGERNGQR